MGETLQLVEPEKISVVCRKVEQFDESFQEIVDNMIATLLATNNGVGLAAPQVGYDVSVAVIRPYLHDLKLRDETVVIVNPQIDSYTKPWIQRITAEEGCLSFPGRFEQIPRLKTVTLKAQDRTGKESTIRLHGWLARIVQHEVDHLHGIVCFSRAKKFEDLPKKIRNKRRKYVRGNKHNNDSAGS